MTTPESGMAQNTELLPSETAGPSQSWTSSVRLFLDHVGRVARATGGFRIFGLRWLRPWFSYVFSPLLNRLWPARTVRFADFNVRRGQCDLYTFANLFEDYPVPLIERALEEVEMVVDLGANVGAFSLLIEKIAAHKRKPMKITAIEPNSTNVQFLREQPFADSLLIHHAAVGPNSGTARLVRGRNSVSDHVDFQEETAGTPIPVLSLESLCPVPALVKMDIEGGEWSIFEKGLPENVRHLVLEWHPRTGSAANLEPRDFVPGNWLKISTGLDGLSMWYLRR